MRRASLALALLAAGLAAYQDAGKRMDRLDADPLHRRAEQVRGGASCSAMVPLEFGSGFPVPARGGGYELFFYPLKTSSDASEAATPIARAHFTMSGAPSSDLCVRVKGLPSPAGPALRRGLSQAEYYRDAAGVYEGLRKASELYAKGAAAGPADRAALAALARDFRAVAEPGLLPDYYRANPDFWEWLRREGGDSIPKPADAAR